MAKALEFTFWDVQHGNSTHIKTPNNKHVVVDLGDGEPVLNRERFSPLKALNALDVQHIDQLVVTHPHRDHIDDIDNVNLFYVPVMVRPKWLTEAEIRQGNRTQDADKVAKYLAFSSIFADSLGPAQLTNVASNWGGDVSSLHGSVPAACHLNNHSIVTVAEYEGMKALIPGDNESISWRMLLTQPAFRNELAGINLFLAAHHGREAGYCIELFQAGLNPLITVISDDQQGETSVTAEYSGQTQGWFVHRGYVGGQKEKRFCVTTRCDGTIRVQFGIEDDGQRFLQVVTEK